MLSLRVGLVYERAVASELPGDLRPALRPIDMNRRADVRGNAGDVDVGAERLPVAGADADDRDHTGDASHRPFRGQADRREVVGGGDRVVRDERLVDVALEPSPQAGGQHGDEGDQRQPDHQRRCGRGGPRRIARRVALGELARRTADLRRRPAQDLDQRRHQLGREHREADEQSDRPDADGEQPQPRRQTTRHQADQHQHERADDRACRHVRAVLGPARRRQQRTLARRGDRGHARRSERRPHRRDQRDDDPDRAAR